MNKTLSADNKFRFKCPIFNTEVQLAQCFSLEEQFMKGRGPKDVRRGCQACMASGKCPTWHIQQEIRFRDADDYFAKDDALRELDPSLLKHIAPIITLERHIEHYQPMESHAALIRLANENAHKFAAGQIVYEPPKRKKKPAAALEEIEPVEPAKDDSALIAAAMSGDMSAAITKATQAEGHTE